MAKIAAVHTDRLSELKKNVDDARQYFINNYNRYKDFMQFVFASSLTQNQMGQLVELGMPTIEFNILEAYISRLRGEFAKQQPGLTVRAADGVPLDMLTPQFVQMLDVVEAHLKAIFFDGSNDMLEYNVYSDLLAGGFSVLQVFTDYVNFKSFEQNIIVEKCNPLLCVFDPLATKSHKGDGRYCAQLFPMTLAEFNKKFGEDDTVKFNFTQTNSGFDWSYKNQNEPIVLVADYYEKKDVERKLLRLTNGHSVLEKDYELFLQEWEQQGILEQPPQVIQSRKTMVTEIWRYRFCEKKILDVQRTNYSMLPLVFVDGNSVLLNKSGEQEQMTRPYVFHAMGIQRLKNLAGQSLANEIENTIQHKFIVPLESIPVDYQEAYQNVQKADTLVYNHFLDTNNPDVVLPPPREIQRTPIPPEISNTFRMSDEMTQTILGSYDNQNISNAQMSGIAMARSAIKSNSASVPYIVGYIKGINRVAEIIVDLIPKYYRTPRSLPILLPNGKRSFVEINKQGSLYMNFDPNSLQVNVEVGVNFAMQKEIALQTLTTLMQASPLFNQFMNQYGLPILLDNIDIRGIEELKEKANEFMQQVAQQQQQGQQQQMQQQQMQAQQQQIAMQAAEQKLRQGQIEILQGMKDLHTPTSAQAQIIGTQAQAATDAANIAVKQRMAENDFIKIMADVQAKEQEHELRKAEVDAENARTSIEGAIKLSEHLTKESDKDVGNID